LSSRALAYGQGIFETIYVNRSSLILFDEHLDRLILGAQQLKMYCSKAEIMALCDLFVVRLQNWAKGGHVEGLLKISLWALKPDDSTGWGYGTLGLSASLLGFVFTPKKQKLSAASIRLIRLSDPLYPQPKALIGLKTTSALQYVHWSQQVLAAGFDQGLLFDENGVVVEGTSANVVVQLQSGDIVTPGLSRTGVRGTLRRHLLEKKYIREADALTEIDLYSARRLLMINSVRGLQFVSQYQGQSQTKSAYFATTLSKLQPLPEDQELQALVAYVAGLFS